MGNVLAGLATLTATLGVSLVMSPLWLFEVLRREKPAGAPNAFQNLLTHVGRTFIYFISATGFHPHANTRTPSALRDRMLLRRFVWIQPAPLAADAPPKAEGSGGEVGGASLVFDDAKLPVRLNVAEAKKRTAALWFLNRREPGVPPTLGAPKRQSPVLLYFHGGAYISLEAGDPFYGLTWGRMMAKHSGMDMLSVNYRLAPASKFPAQLCEALTAFRHLRSLGYEHILVGGDSAGANLSLLLWRYLHEVARDDAAVRGLYLVSPWVDPETSKRASFQERTSRCLVPGRFAERGTELLRTHGKPSTTDGWFSPLRWDDALLARLPPTLVVNGGIEVLLEEGAELVGRAQKAGAASVRRSVYAGYPHSFHAVPWLPGGTRRAIGELAEWAESLA